MAETRDSIRDVWGPRTPYPDDGRWPARLDERTVEEPDRWVQSCCVLCSNGCGMDIGVKGGGSSASGGVPTTTRVGVGSDPRGSTAGRRTTVPTG